MEEQKAPAGPTGRRFRGLAVTEAYAGGYRNPIEVIGKDIRRYGYGGGSEGPPAVVPRDTDIVIMGGGVMGMSAAYWIKQRNPKGYSVTVIERDPTVSKRVGTPWK